MMSGGGLLSCLERHSLRLENGAKLLWQFQSQHNLVCDQRLSTAKPGFQGLVFVGIGGTHQSGLGTKMCIYFGVGITIAVIKRKFVDSRQADQASAEPRGTRTRGSMSMAGGEREGDRAPVCPCLAYLSLHTSELTLRSAGQFRPRRQGRKRGGDDTVAFLDAFNDSGGGRECNKLVPVWEKTARK